MKKNLTVLISAGATREYIDPVRFISNSSTGRMGFSIAEVISPEVKKVLLISGYTSIDKEFALPKNVKKIFVESTLQMKDAILKYIKSADIFISVAAVSDFRPQKLSKIKLKKTKKPIILKLIPNPDILTEVSKLLRPKLRLGATNSKLLVGFALETDNLIKNAIEKLDLKKLDLIVVNTTSTIGSKYITGYIIDKYRKVEKIKNLPKKLFAKILWLKIKKIYEQKFAEARTD
ncbi:MAG: phosphopantothenoylcysteine decarboxylase [Elusimicrobiota bacterium]|nr:phosphopantothenoylcysteine decarboxylase [Elusimicrobiota bacterium]